MKILTWNILAAEWIKQSYYPGVKKNILFNRKKRFAAICELILNSGADVILLQEVMKDEHKKISRLLSNKYTTSPLKLMYWSYTKGKSYSGNMSLFRTKMFRNIRHTEMPSALFTECQLTNGKTINLFNLHLDDLSPAVRRRQLSEMLSAATSDRVILAGDFNHKYTAKSPFYKIPGYKVHNKCPTFMEKKMVIDNIISRGFVKIREFPCHWYPPSQESGIEHYGSDHIPVGAVLQLKK